MNLPNTALHQCLNWHAVTSVRGRNRFLPVRIFVWKWIYSFTRLAASSWDNLTVDSASVRLEQLDRSSKVPNRERFWSIWI